MKRLICLVLAFVIFFGICGIIAPDINNIYKLKEADSFAEQVNVLVKQYESRQDTQNRLIVNSNKIKGNVDDANYFVTTVFGYLFYHPAHFSVADQCYFHKKCFVFV